MNERYLFRGKRKDNGEWVTGYLIKGNNTYIVTPESIYYMVVSISYIASVEFVEVIPETVGQCTGLKDKNGNWVFEEDIAKFRRFENNYIGKIIFNHKTAGFEFWWNIVAGAYGEKATYTANLSVCDEIEVFGSVHDNPELLEVE